MAIGVQWRDGVPPAVGSEKGDIVYGDMADYTARKGMVRDAAVMAAGEAHATWDAAPRAIGMRVAATVPPTMTDCLPMGGAQTPRKLRLRKLGYRRRGGLRPTADRVHVRDGPVGSAGSGSLALS